MIDRGKFTVSDLEVKEYKDAEYTKSQLRYKIEDIMTTIYNMALEDKYNVRMEFAGFIEYNFIFNMSLFYSEPEKIIIYSEYILNKTSKEIYEYLKIRLCLQARKAIYDENNKTEEQKELELYQTLKKKYDV